MAKGQMRSNKEKRNRRRRKAKGQWIAVGVRVAICVRADEAQSKSLRQEGLVLG